MENVESTKAAEAGVDTKRPQKEDFKSSKSTKSSVNMNNFRREVFR